MNRVFFRDTVPLARGASTHARRWYSTGIKPRKATYSLAARSLPLLLHRRCTADVQGYLHHGPEAPCYVHTEAKKSCREIKKARDS